MLLCLLSRGKEGGGGVGSSFKFDSSKNSDKRGSENGSGRYFFILWKSECCLKKLFRMGMKERKAKKREKGKIMIKN